MALTWQNVSPSNPAGILQAGNMAAANIAKGLDVVGSSMQEYAGDVKDAETGKLLLMLDNAKDRNARQNVLDNFDMDYVDQDIIAKDNQEFEAVEEQRKNVLFSQGIQTAAAEAQQKEAGERTDQRTFMREDALLKGRERIENQKRTGEYQATTLENAAERKKLELAKDTAAIKALADSKQRTFDQTAARNKEEKEHDEYIRSVAKGAAEQRKTVFDQGQTAFTKKQQLDKAGKDLVATANPLIDATNDISELIKIRGDLRNKQLEDNPKAPDLIKKVNTKLGTIINISNLFPSRPGVPTPTMTITGTTQDQRARSANSNLQRTIDKLSVYLPRSTNDDLKSMASTILRNSSPEYRKAMDALKIPSEELNNDLDLKLKGELQELRQSGGVLTLDELQGYRDRINLLEVNKDSATGIEKSVKRLNAEYSKVFARTPLTDIISDRSLTNYMTLGDSAALRNGIVDKRAVKKRHKSNIQNIIGLIPTIHRNKLNYEELQQKISNSLTRQPDYAGILDAAGVDYTADIQDKTNRKNLQWAGMRELIDDDSTIGAIHKAYTWVDKNLVEGRDTELTKLTERLHKKLDKDTDFLNIDMNFITYGFVTKINDPSGKVDANGKPVKIDRFDSGEYEKFREHTKRDILEKYKHVSDSAINKMLAGILVKHPNIVKAKTAYDDELAFEKLYGNQNNLNTIKNKIKDTNFAVEFAKSPAAALSAYDLDIQMTKDIIKDADVDDKTDTFRDSIKFSRYVVDLLKEKWSTMSSLELGERAKRVMFALPPRQEWLGDDYTRDSRGLFTGLWMYSDEEIYAAARK